MLFAGADASFTVGFNPPKSRLLQPIRRLNKYLKVLLPRPILPPKLLKILHTPFTVTPLQQAVQLSDVEGGGL